MVWTNVTGLRRTRNLKASSTLSHISNKAEESVTAPEFREHAQLIQNLDDMSSG